MIEDDNLLKKCNIIWYKFCTDTEKEFDVEPVYNKEFLKTKLKSHGDEVTEKILKVDSSHTCLAVISLDSVYTLSKKSFWKSWT